LNIEEINTLLGTPNFIKLLDDENSWKDFIFPILEILNKLGVQLIVKTLEKDKISI